MFTNFGPGGYQVGPDGELPPVKESKTTSATGNMLAELDALMPGFSENVATASGNIAELLRGQPSPALARNAAAYYGVNSGMPGSEFVRNKGFDLYNTQANAMKAQGQDELGKLLASVSGTAVARPGEVMQNAVANRGVANQEQQTSNQANQFGQSFGFEQQQWQKQLELLEKYLGSGSGGGSGPAGGGNVAFANGIGPSGQPGDYLGGTMNPSASNNWWNSLANPTLMGQNQINNRGFNSA